MNILIFISSLSFGGAEKQAVADANLLCKHNKVLLISFTDGPLIKQLNEKVTHLYLKKENYIKTARRLARLVKKNGIQIIHSSLFAPMTIAALAGFFFKTPVIWHFHSHEYDIPLRSRLSFRLLQRLPWVKKILFVNSELKTYFLNRFNFPIKKTGILFNCSQFSKSNYKKKNNFFNIGYVGRLVKLKRVHYLIELADYLVKNKIDGFQIQIIGDGSEKQKLEEYSKKLKLHEKIIFHGFKSDTEIYYESMDLFVNPSKEECLSLALIDAGIKGIPSIAFNVGGNNEIVINNKTGYIVNTRVELFTKCIYLYRNDTLRLRFSKQAIIYCDKNFSKALHLNRLLEIYRSFE
jgi:L-malate glycosyltransferase